jgi:hypothetical protein
MVAALPTEVPAPPAAEVAACAFEAWADTFRAHAFKHRVVPLPEVRPTSEKISPRRACRGSGIGVGPPYRARRCVGHWGGGAPCNELA